MKLLRYGLPGQEKPGVLAADGTIRDLSNLIPDLSGPSLLPDSIEKLRQADVSRLPRVEGKPRLGPCVSGVGKFICIGLNYSDHAAESGMAVPAEPVLFMKATSAICGPDDDVVIPRGSKKSDWEVELGVVIGKPAKYVSKADALSHVAGYCVVNDLSERAFQLESTGQWTKGKSADTFGPIGPWLVTADEVPDPQNLDYVAGSRWPPLSERVYKNHGVRRGPPDQLHKPVHEPEDRRHHLDWDTSRSRQRAKAACIPACRQSHQVGISGLGQQEQKVVADVS